MHVRLGSLLLYYMLSFVNSCHHLCTLESLTECNHVALLPVCQRNIEYYLWGREVLYPSTDFFNILEHS